MRYYVFVISTSESGENRETFAFDNRDGAIEKYHSKMSSAMAGSVINVIQVIVANSANGIEIADKWTREVAEPEA